MLADENGLLKDQLKATQNDLTNANSIIFKTEKDKKKMMIENEQLTVSVTSLKKDLEDKDNQIINCFKEIDIEDNKETRENLKKVLIFFINNINVTNKSKVY